MENWSLHSKAEETWTLVMFACMKAESRVIGTLKFFKSCCVLSVGVFVSVSVCVCVCVCECVCACVCVQ